MFVRDVKMANFYFKITHSSRKSVGKITVKYVIPVDSVLMIYQLSVVYITDSYKYKNVKL